MSCIDLRTVAQIAAGTGYGLFKAQPETITDAISLGDDLDGKIDRAMVVQEFGLGEALVSKSVRGVIWELTTMHADPTGVDRVAPVMPTSRRKLEIHLDGLIYSSDFDIRNSTEASVVKKRLQEDYRRIREIARDPKTSVPSDHHRKVLGHWKKKFRTDDHEQFIPTGLPNESPLKPATTVSDDFNRSNENLEASANWSLLNGGAGTESLVVFSNQCREDTTSATGHSHAQYQTALSSDDHTAEITIEALVAPGSARSWGGASARCSSNSGSANAYNYQATIDSSSVVRGRLLKFTGTGPSTTVLIDETETVNTSDIVLTKADGSNISGSIAGVVTGGPTTDTSLTGDLNVGLASRIASGSVGDIELDNFSGSDLAVATNPKGPLGHPLHGPFGGPIGA